LYSPKIVLVVSVRFFGGVYTSAADVENVRSNPYNMFSR
jgi:hypothetical protein